MKEEKVTFRRLSIPLKIATIGAWVLIVINAIAFTVGFLIGLLEV